MIPQNTYTAMAFKTALIFTRSVLG